MSAKVRLAKLWQFLESIPLDPPASAAETPIGPEAESDTPKGEAIIFTCEHCSNGRYPGEPRYYVIPSYQEVMNFGAPNDAPTTVHVDNGSNFDRENVE